MGNMASSTVRVDTAPQPNKDQKVSRPSPQPTEIYPFYAQLARVGNIVPTAIPASTLPPPARISPERERARLTAGSSVRYAETANVALVAPGAWQIGREDAN